MGSNGEAPTVMATPPVMTTQLAPSMEEIKQLMTRVGKALREIGDDRVQQDAELYGSQNGLKKNGAKITLDPK
eukprot:2933883-Amphidinium_carterae.1